MLEAVANKFKAFYRRYSDDIMVVCDKKDADFIVFLVRRFIRKYAGLDLAKNKTERFECYEENEMLRVKKIVAAGKKGKNYLTYLGFEFHGDKTLLRGSTLAGYHRKMRKSISAVEHPPSFTPVGFTEITPISGKESATIESPLTSGFLLVMELITLNSI